MGLTSTNVFAATSGTIFVKIYSTDGPGTSSGTEWIKLKEGFQRGKMDQFVLKFTQDLGIITNVEFKHVFSNGQADAWIMKEFTIGRLGESATVVNTRNTWLKCPYRCSAKFAVTYQSVEFCDTSTGSGKCCSLSPGAYGNCAYCAYHPNNILTSNPCPANDRISYINVPANCEVNVWQHCPNCGGAVWTLQSGIHTPPAFGDNTISHAVITCNTPTPESPSVPNKINLFEIDPVTGEMKVNIDDQLNFEVQNKYDIILSVRDNSGTQTNKSVVVNILDLNEPPTSSSKSAYIDENAQLGARVTDITCSDPDIADTVFKYSIESGNTGSNFIVTSANPSTTAYIDL